MKTFTPVRRMITCPLNYHHSRMLKMPCSPISLPKHSIFIGRRRQTYVTNLNNLTQGKPEANQSLEELIRTAPEGGLFNNAAQVWNHTFYWNSMARWRHLKKKIF